MSCCPRRLRLRLQLRANNQNEPNFARGAGDLFLNPQAGSPAWQHQQHKRGFSSAKRTQFDCGACPSDPVGQAVSFLTRKRACRPASAAPTGHSILQNEPISALSPARSITSAFPATARARHSRYRWSAVLFTHADTLAVVLLLQIRYTLV